jgi:hypothetical protein
MRIRLSQLRRIIKEEVKRTLLEGELEGEPDAEALRDRWGISENAELNTLNAAAKPYKFTFPEDLFDNERAQSFKITGSTDAPVEPEDFQDFIDSLPEPKALDARHLDGKRFGPFTADSVLHHMKTSFKGVKSLLSLKQRSWPYDDNNERLPDIEVSCPGFVSGLDSHQRSQYE